MNRADQDITNTHLHCPSCGYNLTGLTSRSCPECGQAFTIEKARYRPPPNYVAQLLWLAYALVGACLLGIPLILVTCTNRW